MTSTPTPTPTSTSIQIQSISHTLLLNESIYKQLASNKKRPLYLHEWLLHLDKNLATTNKSELKKIQPKLILQLLNLFNSFPGPALRHLIAKNIANLYSHGDLLSLHQTIEKCNDLLKSKEHETQMNQMSKLCALNTLGAIYERLGRTVGTSYEDTIQILFKYMKSADSQVRIEIVQTFEKVLLGLGTASVSIHKDIFKQLKPLLQDRNMSVRSASVKSLCEMIKHSTFLYLPPQTVSNSSTSNPNSIVSHELDASVQLGLKALDNSNFDVRVSVSVYLAQLIYYSISHSQRQQMQLQHQQQLVNASVSQAPGSNEKGESQKRQQSLQQQQNQNAQGVMQERIKNTLNLLSNGFNKSNQSSLSGSFNLVRGTISSSGVSTSTSSNSVSSSNNTIEVSPGQNEGSSNPQHVSTSPVASQTSTSSQISRETRIGVTYAYVELANLLGPEWLEKNLKLYLSHVLNLVNNTRAVQTHLDAVYSRKCVQFILRSIIGGMLNENVQLQAAYELINVIEKCLSSADQAQACTTQQHVLICAIYELSCILKTLNTSASILVNEDSSSVKLTDKLFKALLYPNLGVKCVAAWCLRMLTCSLPSLMTNLLENCMDKLSLIRNPSDALTGYGYACAALLGAVNECPLGVPSLKPKLAFNIGEELLRSASQSSNLSLALQKTSIGWLLIGAFMTIGSSLVRKHLPRLKKLWTLTMPSSIEQIESEKKRGDLFTWQLSLESRSGALASIHSFLINCADLVSNQTDEGYDHTIGALMNPIEAAIMLLAQLPSIIKLNNSTVNLKAQAAMFRLKLYQTLISLPTPQLYEANFAVILSELVAEFTLADQSTSSLVTSTLRSVCHSNDSILFANCWLQDSDYKQIEDQLQPHSASGCEALEHDVTYLYQKTAQTTPNSILNVTTIKSLTTSSFFSSLSSMYATSSNLTTCQSALPLGVAVIDASIQLFGLMYPKCPNKHRLQMILHFNDLVLKQPISRSNQSNKQALQINIFTSVLGALKSLAEAKSELGDEAIRKATLKLVMETLCHSNPVLRCAAGEALGRMAQVVAESHFVIEVGQFCFEKLRNSQDVTSRTGYALGLGCLHRYVGSMGAGQQMTSSVSILFAMAQNPSSSIVQVWAIHALYLIIDSGGSMFRNYIEPCVEFIVQSVLSIPYTNRDVFVGLGKLLSSLITFMGPELQMDSVSIGDVRVACLTTCTVMQKHTDSMIRSQAVQCLQEMHLFAPKHVNLGSLVPYLINSIVSKEFLLRKVSVSCMRQLCQKDALEVCRLARKYVEEMRPNGLLCLISERGLEFLVFKMLDIETNPVLIRDLHDILYSLLCTSLNEVTLKDWLFLCKDIAISAEESLVGSNGQTQSNETSHQKKPKSRDETENDDFDDDSQTLNVSTSTKNSHDFITSKSINSQSNAKLNHDLSQNLKLKQITKIISPKWPNRVFAFELIRRIISMFATPSPETDLKKQAHFDLQLAKKLKQQTNSDEHYLILFLQDLMRIACIGATSSCDPLKLVGLDLLHDLILYFSAVEEPNPEFKGHLILEQYQAQVSAALRPQFSIETSAHVTAKACQVCSMWISSGVARDLNDLRRVHQLLVSSLQKLSTGSSISPSPQSMLNNDHLIYSELSLTVEKLAVLRAWAEVYIVAQKKSKERVRTDGSESLLNLVQPELALLSHHWSVALKDYAFLCLPNEYSSQLPIEGGAFYHADLVESSKPIYKEHFTKILLAYSIWLNEIKFNIIEVKPAANQKLVDDCEQKEKLFFMLLGLSLETLSNTQGLAQLSDETIENILESLDYLMRTCLAKSLLLKKSLYLCVEVLSILYKIKLSRDLMSINVFVINIVKQINELRLRPDIGCNEVDVDENEKKQSKREKNASALIFVILEICIKDLIRYLPNLLQLQQQSKLNPTKSSFLYLHVTKCKQLTQSDVELLKNVLNVLNDLPFHSDLKLEKRISLVSIVYHILFNLLQSIESLLNKTEDTKELESILFNSIYESFKTLCSTSSNTSQWNPQFHLNATNPNDDSNTSTGLIQIQQSSLMSTLNLKHVSNHVIMKLLSIYFQYCSIRVFEPLNVYEKCKVFMCSMRCSDNRLELLCMIQSLNEILINTKTRKEIRIILIKEHLSYLLKLISSTSNQNELVQNSFLSLANEHSLQLISSLLDLLESMVVLMTEDSDENENETLAIYVHILGMYLNEESVGNSEGFKVKKRAGELNDFVIKKLINLGVNHKQELKQVLEKWPSLKMKIGNALKSSQNGSSNDQNDSNRNRDDRLNTTSANNTKTPKIQLNFNFSKK